MKAKESIRKYLNESGLRNDWFAKQIGLTPGRFSQMLCDNRPVPEKFWKRIVECTQGVVTLADLLEDRFSSVFEVSAKEKESVNMRFKKN